MELLIIGLDALDPYLIEEHLDELPTFRHLRKDAEWHVVRCDAEKPNTVNGWASIYTGKLTKEHGLENWDLFSEDSEWLGLASKLEGKFWDRLNAAGYSVGLLNPPLVWPAWKGRDWCIAGFPDPLTQKLRENKGMYSSVEVEALAPPRYLVGAGSYVDHKLTVKDRQTWYLPEVKSLARIRLAYAVRLLLRFPVDVGFVCFVLLDRLGHGLNYLMNSEIYYGIPNERTPEQVKDELRRGYRLADRIVRNLLDEIEPKNFIICADHGFNFSDVMPALNGLGDWVVGHPNWLGHTGTTAGFAGGQGVNPSKTEEQQMTWAFGKIFELLGIEAPEIEGTLQEAAFTEEEEAVAKSRLEGLGYV